MAEKIYWVKEGLPYFLDETETGIFYPVIAFRGFDNPGHSVYEYDFKVGKLVLGYDVAEMPNRGISILLKTDENGFQILLAIIHECIKIARISNYDFVSIEHFGGKMGNLIKTNGKTKIIEIRPRFFKKIKKEKDERPSADNS